MFIYDNSKVRRQERTIDQTTAIEILKNSEYGVLSMIENRGGQMAAYGIPVNYVWDKTEYLYFHCAPSGHKLECIDSNELVSFTVVGDTNVISHKFTTAYESVVVRGKIERGLPPQERLDALKLLLDKYSPNDKELGIKYTEKSFHRTEILRLTISEISGKAKRVDR